MDYDFSSLCEEQLEKLQKRLTGLNKSFIKEYKIVLNVINNETEREHRSETVVEIEDILRDLYGKCDIFYTQAMGKIQSALSRHL